MVDGREVEKARVGGPSLYPMNDETHLSKRSGLVATKSPACIL